MPGTFGLVAIDFPTAFLRSRCFCRIVSIWQYNSRMSSWSQVTNRFTIPQSRTARIMTNAIIWALWLWLYWPLAAYLRVIFSREDFRTNQIILIGIVVLVISRARKEGWHFPFTRLPQVAPLPLALAMGGSIAYLLAERFLDVHTLAASLFGLATYGLLGLWLSPRRWRQGLLAALLLIGTLPFGDHLQTFVGYPMRIGTAVLVRNGLHLFGIHTVGVDTILVFENGVSHIDVPCSGVKSLWTGMLFLLAATWVEERPLTLRWFVTAVIFAGLLFIANLLRVAILVVVGEVLNLPLFAQMLHIPLGVLGFIAACAAAVKMLRAISSEPLAIRNEPFTIHNSLFSIQYSFPLFLISSIALMALAYTPRPQTGLTQAAQAWPFPAEMAITPLPLKPDEVDWLTRDGADSAERQQFAWRGYSGSMILITSRTWRAHHRPERCFEVYGLTLDDSRTHLVTPQIPVRFVELSDGDGRYQHSATYWFQSATQITDDYGTRIWADLAPQRDRWVLVSILFDDTVNPNDPDIQDLYLALQQTITDGLTANR
ncbi:MAG: exosortase O [Ardenticatenaceae bacterium]|nr:exosortase O [Anaerolineales bacterium]MCB8922421.1 exosortase O [Ardenticatenaceae bacterium]MCB8991353.1 exosortase O [Ardenticatenaceae bacterium]MCB9005575.1 exosortase O [Ardenticatenaceae bacterium]